MQVTLAIKYQFSQPVSLIAMGPGAQLRFWEGGGLKAQQYLCRQLIITLALISLFF